MNEIHEDDYGWTLNLTVKDENGDAKDLSLCTRVNIVFSRPNNTGSISKEASFETDGSDGKIYYIVADGDIDVSGTWQLQVEAVFTNSVLRSNIQKFKVYRNI